MKRKLVFLVLIITILTSGVFAVENYPRLYTRVEDDAGLMTDGEVAELRAYLDEISNKHNVDVIIHTTNSLGDKSPRAYADDYFDYNGYGMGEGKDGIILILSMEYRDWAISTHGFAIEAFTDQGQKWIMDEVLQDFSQADFYEGFRQFAFLADEYIGEAKTGHAYDIGYKPKNEINLKVLIVMASLSLLIGAGVGLAYLAFLKSSHKTKKRKEYAEDYQTGIIPGRNTSDRLINRYVSRVPIPKPPSNNRPGGGGSSTWTSSSGGFHGGSSGKF